MQIYKDMDIGTAKIKNEEMRRHKTLFTRFCEAR